MRESNTASPTQRRRRGIPVIQPEGHMLRKVSALPSLGQDRPRALRGLLWGLELHVCVFLSCAAVGGSLVSVAEETPSPK